VVSANDAAVDAFAEGKVTLLGLPVERLGFFDPADTRLREALERALHEGSSFRYLRVGERRVHGASLARGPNGPQLLLLLDGKEDEPNP
jgi:hypothetical protein